METSEQILFSLARSRIVPLLFGTDIHLPPIPDELRRPGAAFVTLTIDQALRGCVGSLVAHRPLWEDITENGHNAAFHDFRFAPLTAEEYPHIKVEVSILTAPEPIQFDSREQLQSIVRPFIDGIIFTCRGYRATFLPQVWEQLPDFDLFFSHLSQKAGVGATPDFSQAEIQRYQVERYHE